MLSTMAASAPTSSTLTSATAIPASSSTATTTTPTVPTVPERPAALTSATTSPFQPYGGSPYSRFGTGAYGAGYGGLGYSGLGSPYGYGGLSAYGGLGGLGSLGYGSYGYGGGMGGVGMFGGPNGVGGVVPIGPDGQPRPPSLTQSLESTTQQTFALLHSIVQTFTGMAQMLESTFMATHSSFFAMVGVVDQFTQLRNALGSVLGLFGLLRWLKEVITGQRSIHDSPGASGGLNTEFKQFINGQAVQNQPAQSPAAKASKKPIIIFLLAIFGIPYAMNRLIRILQERAQAQVAANGGVVPGQLPPLDPSSLTFARALYAYTASNPNELALKENEIVAITGKIDSRTGAVVDPRLDVDGEWWKGRTRDGREGWFPKKWVEVLQKRKPEEPKKVE